MDRGAGALAAAVAVVLAVTAGGAVTLSTTLPTSGTVSVQTNSGVVVNVSGGPIYADPFVDDETVAVEGGNVSGPGPAALTLPNGQLNGTTTNVTGLDVDSNSVRLAPDDKHPVELAGDVQQFDYDGVDATDIDDNAVDFSYRGTAGTTTVSLNETGIDGTQVGAVDQQGRLLAVSTFADGNGTFSGMPNSDHAVELVTSDGAPTLANGAPDGAVNDDPVTLSVDVDDPDFASDNVTVEFRLDGSTVATETLDDAGTVTHTVNSISAGNHTWSAIATDRYGQTTSEQYDLDVPSALFFRNETNASQLVDSPTTVEVRFFAENGSVYERQTTSGSIDMRGLPASQDFLVQADAGGYYSRTVYLDSLIQQQSVYLLNKSASSAEIVFELDDRTGRFPASDTTLYVEKPINRSGTVEYRTVVSNQFGAANEIVTTLEDGERYRLRVQSPTGETRVLGGYQTAGDDRAVLPIGEVSIGNAPAEGPAFSASMTEDGGQAAVQLVYRDTAQATDDLRLEIYPKGQPNTLVRANTSETVDGVYSETYVLPGQYAQNDTFVVRYHANRTDASDVGGTDTVGSVGALGFGGLDPQVLSLIGWVGLVAVAGFVAPVSGALGAIASVIFASFLTIVGVLSIPAALLGLAGATAVLFVFGGVDL